MMIGWHHRLNGHESEQALGDSEGQGGLECCSPWGRKESDTTDPLNSDEWAPASVDRMNPEGLVLRWEKVYFSSAFTES